MTETDRLSAVSNRLREFASERDWEKFHDPKNLAMAIVSEVGELVAELRWIPGEKSDELVRDPAHRTRIEHEIADIAISLLMFCHRAGIDLVDAMNRKIDLNCENYPVNAARGISQRPDLSRPSPSNP
jgi:dCTP diphosphatase